MPGVTWTGLGVKSLSFSPPSFSLFHSLSALNIFGTSKSASPSPDHKISASRRLEHDHKTADKRILCRPTQPFGCSASETSHYSDVALPCFGQPRHCASVRHSEATLAQIECAFRRKAIDFITPRISTSLGTHDKLGATTAAPSGEWLATAAVLIVRRHTDSRAAAVAMNRREMEYIGPERPARIMHKRARPSSTRSTRAGLVHLRMGVGRMGWIDRRL